jgi:hypothetical protein
MRVGVETRRCVGVRMCFDLEKKGEGFLSVAA